MTIKLPEIKIDIADESFLQEVRAILYALLLIRQETSRGTLTIEVVGGKIGDMKAEHNIRPKYLPKYSG
jgi:hypothetical protein